jgi:CRISPR system Cascade subunit CasB
MPKNESWWGARLVAHLNDLDTRGERGALAELRRALQRPPGEDANVFRHVIPFIGGASERDEPYAFLVASLFATHPDAGGKGTLGKAFQALAAKTNSEGVERRFASLLNADAEDVHHHLRHGVSLLRGAGIPVDWEQLLRDLSQWGHPGGYVQRSWARDFWGYRKEEKTGTVNDKNAAAAA